MTCITAKGIRTRAACEAEAPKESHSMFYALVFQMAAAGSNASIIGPFASEAACNAKVVERVQWWQHNAGRAAHGMCSESEQLLAMRVENSGCVVVSQQPSVGPLPTERNLRCTGDGL